MTTRASSTRSTAMLDAAAANDTGVRRLMAAARQDLAGAKRDHVVGGEADGDGMPQ